MTLPVGTHIGPYEIVDSIGAGGMGEVYRATDSKLRRAVALKVLPQAFAQDQHRMERFAREARVLAALNHPNIAAIYGSEENALVMELVEGETLAERIQRGPVPLTQAIKIARQIVDALDAAHEKQIIHRDLKPANVKLTPQGVVKVLDFGLAKIQESPSSTPSGTELKTVEMTDTQAGVILGTSQYMAPEQARGEIVDKRADIWSFGVLLYELITARPPFAGKTRADIMAAVLKAEPDWEPVPVMLRPLLERCLAKDVSKRLRDIGDVHFALDLLSQNVARPPASKRAVVGRMVAWVLAGLFAATSVAALYMRSRTAANPENAMLRFTESLGPEAAISGSRGVAVSPDGRRLVYVAAGPTGTHLLYTRRLDQTQTAPLGGTEGAGSPFFSPDGQSIGFFAGGKLKSIHAEGGGPVVEWCDAPSGRGGAWMEDGSIVAALNNRAALYRIPASGGAPQRLTELSPDSQENSHRWPQILAGGKALLFMAGFAGGGSLVHPHVEVQSLQNGQRKTLRPETVFARVLPSGHLIYVQNGTLFAAPMNLESLELTGPPVPTVDDVFYSPGFGDALVAFSRTGTLAYVNGKDPEPLLAVYWLKSNGQLQPLIEQRGRYSGPRLSPDGKRLALALTERENTDIWIYDFKRENMTRLTFDPGVQEAPVWTPDGNRIAFRSGKGIAWVRIDGLGGVEHLTESKSSQYPQCFTPDGRRLVYEELNSQTGLDIWTIPLMGADPEHLRPGKPEIWLKTQFSEGAPALSPDGHWLVYRSDESGKNEIYVRPFARSAGAGKWQISQGGADYAVWSPQGRRLFYRIGDGHVMALEYQNAGESFLAGKPRPWSEQMLWAIGFTRAFDVAPDGQRLVVLHQPPGATERQAPAHMNVLVNFFDEARRLTRRGGP